ncbi:alpha/beta hydrolase family protein [Mycolicibacterium baixiangningiae]|uniref:alpha/beta hydrolase family protein n=1 Tax=Mycolicibacterium baixiangningiae TaxID=2761578 RepID=UPI001866EEA6|nr:lipase family protein [Mycolicibacterium baixiangningiae]
MTERARRVLVGVATVALLAGCSKAAEPGLQPGQLLTARPLTTTAALPSADTRLITYVSDDSHGQPIVVSGTVAVPKSPPPDGGWPVISWAHGTTGYADTCAPSADTADGLVHDYVGLVTPVLDTWVERGFAVVQTDYQGLGTPGGHPYIDGTSESNTTTDIVTAARELDPGIGTDWVAIGHSQGGQAALFTAQDAGERAPELDLKGAVAIAPGGVGLSEAVEFVRSERPEAVATQAFLPLLVLGSAVVEPAIVPEQVFTGQARPLLTAARTECLAQIRQVPPVPAAQVFAPDADLTVFREHLDRQDPTHLHPRVPVMIAQGTADTAVAKPGVDALAEAMCGRAVAVDYRVYPGQDHRGVIGASLRDAQDFVSRVISGQPTDTCQR